MSIGKLITVPKKVDKTNNMKYIFFILFFLHLSYAQNVCGQVSEIVASLESDNRPFVVNTHGYLGRYQIGAMGLVDAGLIKKENYFNSRYTINVNGRQKVIWKNGLNLNKFLSNPNNWTIKGGREAFLYNNELQDRVMYKLCNLNAQRLFKKGLNLSNPNAARAILVAAHLGGVESAYNYVKKRKEYKDAYGTPISQYFKIGVIGYID